MYKAIYCLVLCCIFSKGYASENWQLVAENSPPYIGERLTDNGWVTALTKAALANQNINNDIEFTSWNRALELTKINKKDAILGAFYTKSRTDLFYYSRPLANVYVGLFKLKDRQINYDGSMDSLQPYSICKGVGYAVSEVFSESNGLAVTSTRGLINSLYMLQKGRIDLVAGTKEVGEYWLKNTEKLNEPGAPQVEYISPDLEHHQLHVMFPKSDPDAKQKRDALEQGFSTILYNGTAKELLVKHGFSQSTALELIDFIERSSTPN